MRKNLLQGIIFLTVTILIVAGIFLIKQKNKGNLIDHQVKNTANAQNEDSLKQLIFFYGIGCPHCANVEKFFEENKIKEKIQFEEREVYFNKDNAKLLVSIAKEKCGFKENEIGVPFLWDGENSKCIVGDQPIIDFFKQKLNL